MLRQFSIVGYDGAALAQAAEIFAGIETEAAGNADATRLIPFVSGAVSLASVFYKVNIMAFRNLLQRVQIGRLSIEVHGQQRCRTGRNNSFELRRIHVVRNRIDVYEYWTPSDSSDCLRRCNETVRHCNYFIPGTDAKSQENDLQCCRTRIDRDALG